MQGPTCILGPFRLINSLDPTISLATAYYLLGGPPELRDFNGKLRAALAAKWRAYVGPFLSSSVELLK